MILEWGLWMILLISCMTTYTGGALWWLKSWNIVIWNWSWAHLYLYWIYSYLHTDLIASIISSYHSHTFMILILLKFFHSKEYDIIIKSLTKIICQQGWERWVLIGVYRKLCDNFQTLIIITLHYIIWITLTSLV